MGIKCGHCGQQHTTVNQVKACFSGAVVVAPAGPALATEKQEAFLRKLANERQMVEGTNEEFLQRIDTLKSTGELTKVVASTLIEGLLALEKIPGATTGRFNLQDTLANVPAGYYAIDSLTGTNDLDFIRIGLNQGRYNPADKGKKRIQRYLGGQGAIPMDWPEQRKFAEALAGMDETALVASRTLFGTKLGRCGCCGKSLTDQLSRALGIGPECRSKVA